MDLPCQPRFNNSLDGGDVVHGGHYADDLAAKQTEVSILIIILLMKCIILQTISILEYS